jgi:hypothetical protein
MATVAVQTADIDGLVATYSAASAGGDKFAPQSRPLIHVKNASAGAVTVTIATPAKVGGLDIADATASVAAGGEAFIRCPDPALVTGSDGLASISWSAAASVTFAVLR